MTDTTVIETDEELEAQAAAIKLPGRAKKGLEQPAPAVQPVADALPSDDNTLPSDRDPNLAGEEAGLRERFRLHTIDGFYRGSVAGAGRLRAMSHLVTTPDEPDISPELKRARDRVRGEYREIVSDLARYDMLAPWSSGGEAAAAFGGQVLGALPSPESLVGFGVKGASMLARTVKAGGQQAGIQLATDPVVQGLSLKSGVQDEYDLTRTALAPVVGAVIGGGMHVGGELLTNSVLKKMRATLGEEDPSIRAAGDVAADIAETAPAGSTTRVEINGEVGTATKAGEPPPLDNAALVAKRNAIEEGDELALQAWHGSPKTDLTELLPSARGALGPGVYLSPDSRVANRYAGADGKVYSLDVPDADIFHGMSQSGENVDFSARWDEQGERLIAAAAPDKQQAVASLVKELGYGDGYPLVVRLAQLYKSEEGAQALFKKAGFKGITGFADGPELVLFDKASLGDGLALAQRAGGPGTLPMERQRPEAGASTDPDGLTGTNLVTIPAHASPAQADAIRSLQQQATDLADALGFPLRQGRIKNKNALGIFKPGTGVVRVREVPDFEVVAHEAGHYIEAKSGQALTDLTDRFGTELAPLVSNPGAYDPAQHVKEGFAEFVRRYIGNPVHAEQVAPGFTIAFRDFMSRNQPEMLASIDRASAQYRAYLDAPSVDAVGAVVRSRSEEAKGWRGVVKQIREDGFPAIIKTVVRRVYSDIFDDKAPVTRAVREMAAAIKEQSGDLVSLKGADNPEVLLRMFERSHQTAVRDMMDGVRPYHEVTPQGPSLTAALEVATGGRNSGGWGKWDADKKALFSDFLVARRADLLWDKFRRGELPNPPVAFSQADARVAMADLERANPQFRQASDMVHEWTRQLLRKQYDGGLIDAELFNKLSQEQFYVPFMRDLSDKPLSGADPAARGSAKDRVADTVKRMRGSARDIKDPIESLMTQAFLVNRTLAHNDIIRAMVGLAKKAGIEGGRFAEKLPAHEAKKYTFDMAAAVERLARERGVSSDDTRVLTSALTDVFGEDPIVGSFFRMEPAGKRGEPIVFYKEGGQMQAARLMSGEEGHALYEVLTALPKPLTDAWSMMIGASTSLVRAGIVTNPMFALTNYMRDQVAVAILRPDYVPILSGAKGLVAEVRQGESAVLYGYAGGVSGGASITPVERAIEADVNALAKKGYLVNRLTSFKGAMELASITESGTRNSVFAKVYAAKRAQGLSEYESMIEAAFQAQDVLDFSRHGSRTEAIRKYLPFINSYFQGMDKARRTVIEPLFREKVFATDPAERNNALLSATKILGVGGVLGAGWAALHADSEAYSDASPKVKASHIVIPVGNKILLWPKPFELGIGFTAGEYAYQKFAKDDPRAAAQFAEATWDSFTHSNPLYDIPILKTAFELKSGKSLFTGKDIVPGGLQRLLPEQQFTDRTSSLAKQIGKAIGVSPIKVDYAVGQSFGLWGRDIMALSSGVDPDNPAQSWEDRVFARRLLKDPTRTSDVSTKYWEYMGLTTGKYNQNVSTYDDLVKRFQDADAKEFINRLPPQERAFVIMKSAADEDGKAAFNADVKRLHPLQRSYDAVTLLNGVRKELSNNSFREIDTGGNTRLDPVTRGSLIENIRELAQMEMRNAFVIMKEPGYENRALLDTNATMDKIKALSPLVATEIATRYATARIYKTDQVAKSYPAMRDGLLRDGSEADLDDLAADAAAEGYAFDGERVKKPGKRRVRIAP